jgi:hypothetical protein
VKTYLTKIIVFLLLLFLPSSFSAKLTFINLKVRGGEQNFIDSICKQLYKAGSGTDDLVILDNSLGKWLSPIQIQCERRVVFSETDNLTDISRLTSIGISHNQRSLSSHFFLISSRAFVNSKKVQFSYSDFVATSRPTPDKAVTVFSNVWIGEIYPSEKVKYRPEGFKAIPGKTYFFNSSVSSDNGLGQGWSVPESWGVWSIGTSSYIYFTLSESNFQRLNFMIIRGIPFLTERHENLDISLNINANKASQFHLTYPVKEQRLTLRLPPLKVGLNLLRINVSNPASPKNLKLSDDARQLGFGLTSLTIHQ